MLLCIVCQEGVLMNKQSRLDWLKRRQKGIGASDSAQILGFSPWGSALSIYHDKTGPLDVSEPTERMEIGLKIESFIADLFAERTGKKIRRRNQEIYSKEHKFIFATIDRDVLGEDSILECKNIERFDAEKWDSRIPDIYNIQVQHQMYCTGNSKVFLAALFSGNRFEIYEVDRDQEIIDWMVPQLVNFWQNHVLKLIPPIASHIDGPLLADHYPTSEDQFINESDEYSNLIREYKSLGLLIDEKNKRKQEISNIIKQRVGGNKGLITDEYRASWSRWSVQRFDLNKFQEDHPDMYQKYLKNSNSNRLTISSLT